MLRICIPVHNEATTIGVLLWRLRSVFQGFSREYDVVVYDDASTDGTGEVLEPYQSVMPLTVIRGGTHRGYAASIDALVRHVAADDEYARRDAMVLLQGDFTESPEHLPELVKRFEGGADLVAVHRTVSDATPADERRLRRWGRWAVKPFLRMPPVADPFTGFRLVRIAVLRDLLRAMGNRPVCAGDGWAANIDFALNLAPFARRIENVEFAPRYDVRQRASRRRGWADVVALFHWARAARGTPRPVPGSKAAADTAPREPRHADVSVAPTLAERPARAPQERERGGRPDRGGRPGRDDRAAKEERAQRDERPAPREERAARPARDERPPREDRPAREERAPRAERPPREPRPPREERAPRAERPPRPERRPTPESATEPPVPSDAEQSDGAMPTSALDAGAALESSAQELTGTQPDGAAAPGEKRSRRRRRRSRRARGEAGSSTGDEAGDDAEPSDAQAGSAPFRPAPGTTDAAEGEQEDGDDDGDGAESGAEGTGEAGASRRKRRPRRRRRGRRPGSGGEAAGTEGPPPSAAEPPTD